MWLAASTTRGRPGWGTLLCCSNQSIATTDGSVMPSATIGGWKRPRRGLPTPMGWCRRHCFRELCTEPEKISRPVFVTNEGSPQNPQRTLQPELQPRFGWNPQFRLARACNRCANRPAGDGADRRARAAAEYSAHGCADAGTAADLPRRFLA